MTDVDENASFSAFAGVLDSRILRALADLGFARPTLVQAKAIPLALEGRDILARARTGSGKTAAYCVPIIQKILSAKQARVPGSCALAMLTLLQQTGAQNATRALILVPTRELAEQVSSLLKGLLLYCEKAVAFVNVATGTTAHLKCVAVLASA